ncbi:MAG: hypothetical protein CVU48_08350 [Candidatus Cloacimonetes bacterium HGW-Cloacimonetes-1]|jgi:2-polyprenyl-3-methyl-5-hydroxy-6-metoxy-1,4-benzoquinol methylase|nr:MAG: hypothetical protein CVU48_08350 [Candidatus Cloacimonetes bacterium HGW-Cloacimonetes-1]
MKDQTADFFQRYAHDFDAIYGNKHSVFNALINKYLRTSMRLRYERSLAACQPIADKTVLDVGCGPGHYSLALARMGALHVTGIDFAPAMIQLANLKADSMQLNDSCEFTVADFFALDDTTHYDYSILMGFMDYMSDPLQTILKAVSITRHRAVFSFPSSTGILAWQRRLRYKKRCPLYLYSRKELIALFDQVPNVTYTIEPIARDFFVTVDILQ